ncbi:MAG: rhomboid family intramembrane serine protease [Verrucomicrobiales bacterium]|jgi:membrane associated rhomboid family serine protease|nr:rhomboid family intramembrane serine protease [Verrucomicrobiales bacterium]
MTWTPNSGSYSPLGYVRGVPVELTTLLVAFHVAATVAVAAVMGLAPEALPKLQTWTWFMTNVGETGRYWTFLTYPFYHDIRVMHIFFAVEMLLFWWIGREVERFIGRRPFVLLYAALMVTQPLALLVLSSVIGGAASLAGSGMLLFGVGVAFATIYPNTRVFGFAAQWFVWIILSALTAYFVATRNWIGATQLWVMALTAWCFVRNAGVGAGRGLMDRVDDWRLARAGRKSRARAEAQRQRMQREEASVDSVLEKISRNGISSLDAGEHEILQRARRKLLEKERR